jgi:streptogramin lyase
MKLFTSALRHLKRRAGGRPAPRRHPTRLRAEPLEDRSNPAPIITEFSAGISPGANLEGITAGPDGNLWFTEFQRNRVGRITLNGTVTEFPVGDSPLSITAGPDENLWFTENDRIGRITPNGAVTEFSAGITPGSRPSGITTGPDGNLWFTEQIGGRVGRITPDGVVTEFSLGTSPDPSLAGIALGPDGNLWFTEFDAGKVGRITPDGHVTEFSAGISPGASPEGITAGPDGNLWFTELNGDRIGRIIPTNGGVTEFSTGITTGAQPSGITRGPDGNLWFTEQSGDRIGRITPGGVVLEFSAGITSGAQPSGIARGPDGNMWFTEFSGNRIGRLAFTPPTLFDVPNPTVTAGSLFSLTGSFTNPDGLPKGLPISATADYGDGTGPHPITASGTTYTLAHTFIIPGTYSVVVRVDNSLAAATGELTVTVVPAPPPVIPPPTSPGASITEFSAGITPGAQPYRITAGRDGNLWFTESDKIGRITPAGVVTEFSAGITLGAQPTEIILGPDGNLWFTEFHGDSIGRITRSGVVTEFHGVSSGARPLGITAGPDGNLWFTETFEQFDPLLEETIPGAGRIGRITPDGVVTEFADGITDGADPAGITAGPDGNLWFTELAGGRVGRITPDGVVTEFADGITPGAIPSGITTGPDGNLWFTEFLGSTVGRITPAGVVTEFAAGITPGSRPFGIAAGPDGNLWFTEQNGGRVGRITPNGAVTEFSKGITGGGLAGITLGPDRALWFTESSGDLVGRLTFAPPTVFSVPDTTVTAGRPFLLTGSFTNPDGLPITATADYGDGAGPQPATVSGTTYTLVHSFAVPGTYSVVVTIDNSFAAATRTLTVTVAPAPPLVITPATLPGGTVGTAYSQALTAAGGGDTYTVTSGALPPGLTLSPAGALSGTPTAAGGFAFTITVASASFASGSQAYALSILAAAPTPPVLPVPSPPPLVNTPPHISDVADQTVPANGSTGQLALSVSDAETPAAALSVTASSSNPSLVPASGIVISGSGPDRTVTVTPAAGKSGSATITLTVTDAGGLTAPDSFVVTVSLPSPPPTTPPPPPLRVVRPAPLVVSGLTDGTAQLLVADPAGQYDATPAAVLEPFGVIGADVRTAAADVDGDGVADTILITGPGTPTRFAVVSGKDNRTLLVPPTDPFGGFSGGGFVAAGDLDGDGRAEFVFTPDLGGGPNVVVYSLNPDGSLVSPRAFFALGNPAFRGGARAAVGDVNGDGTADVVVAAGFQGGPNVEVHDGRAVAAGNYDALIGGGFFAFDGPDAASLRDGVFVAAGDVNGDGFADLAFGGGPGGAPRVFVLDGKTFTTGGVRAAASAPLANFFVAGDDTDRGGVRVAVVNADGDGLADLVVGSGEGLASHVRVYPGKVFTSAAEPIASQDLDPFGTTLPGGVFVG